MRKSVQQSINSRVESFLATYERFPKTTLSTKQLRHCQATVFTVVNDLTGEVYYELHSYYTVVAVIYKDEAYDFLRLVYGYTSTSAQHIAKFFHDYAPANRRDYLIEHTWRAI